MIHVSYLYDCQPLLCLPNSESIVQAINDGVRFLGTNRNFFIFLSDAARYEGQSISNETFSITLVFLELCN